MRYFIFIFIGLVGSLFTSCENFTFSPNLPLSTEISESYQVTENGTFALNKSGTIFDESELSDVLGNIKSLTIDSLILVVDSTNVSTTDSLPFIDAVLSLSVDTLKLSDGITGTLQSLINDKDGKLLNITPDELITMSIIITDRANNNENTSWSYNLAGTVEGAPFITYFRVKFYGEVETYPAKLF